jgi:D-alanyl-D-alanine carboxypeptidase/D-alanyl-D-alanine-endopeptidase (penicillin-binding protein 4)
MCASAQTPSPTAPLDAQIATLLTDPVVARDHWGIQVTALDGTPIYSLNQAQLFQPASNTKLFTTSAAIALLGPAATFETRIVGNLDPATGTVSGDLTLVGGGDANLSGRTLPYLSPAERQKQPTAPPPDPLRYVAQLADQIAAKGVKEVTGDIVGDDTLFPWEPYPSDWSIDDAVWGYGAPVSALTINDNQIQVVVAPAATAYQPASIALAPAMPYYRIQFSVMTSAAKTGSHVEMERAPGSNLLRIFGTIAIDAPPDSEEVAIQDPAEYAAMALKQMLEQRGISIKGIARAQHWIFPDPRGFLDQTRDPLDLKQLQLASGSACTNIVAPPSPIGAVLASHRSPTLGEDVVVTDKVSQNLHAELLLHHLAQRLCVASTAEGARVVRQFLINAGIDPNDFVFYDGSGLSGHDLVTPRATAKLLQFATTQPWFAAWKSALPIGGEDGSLASRFPTAPLKDHVFAKTGTLGEARALSGYLDAASGRTVIFSIMVGNHLPGTSADMQTMDKIVAAIQSTQ